MGVRPEKPRTFDANGPITQRGALRRAGHDTDVLGHGPYHGTGFLAQPRSPSTFARAERYSSLMAKRSRSASIGERSTRLANSGGEGRSGRSGSFSQTRMRTLVARSPQARR